MDNEYPQVLVTDLDEIVAVWEGEIAGDFYDSDGETWAYEPSLQAWRAAP